MKTQVIQLERHDDVNSVKDKIAWSKASRILLVWPKRGRMLYRPLDLLLLQRACQAEGAQLACVADDDDILDHAKDLGIPVFRSAKIAQRLPWRRHRHKKVLDPRPRQAYAEIEIKRQSARSIASIWQNNRWVRLAATSLSILAILCLVGLLAPEASVTLEMKQELQQMDIPVYASPELPGLNPTGGLPVTLINVIVEGQDSLLTTGTTKIPETVAVGRVQFTNLTDQAVTIPVGMIVQTLFEPVIQYETIREVYLPAKPGSTIEGMIQAKQAGNRGNIPARAIQAVTGPLGASVSVMNLTEISGGRDLTTATATQEDADRLRERLMVQLKNDAIKEVKKIDTKGMRKFDQTLEIAQIIDEKQTPITGFPAEELELIMRVEYKMWAVREDDLKAICLTVLDANLSGNRVPLNATLSMEESGLGDRIQNQLRWQIHAMRQVRPGWNEPLLIQALAGKQVDEGLKNIAQMLELSSPPQIAISPSWWPVIPLLPGRISVVVQ